MTNRGQGSGVREQAGSAVLKGHDFSRAVTALHTDPALAAEGWCVAGENIPQGLKCLRKNGEWATNSRGAGIAGAEARVDFAAFAARLKSCPVTKQVLQRFFPQPVKPKTFFHALFGTHSTSLRAGSEVVPFQNRSRRIANKPVALFALTALLVIAGCRQDMHDQPKIIPQRGSNLFADHRGARPQVVNTVARGQLKEDSYFYTGVTQAANGYREEHDELPFPATMEVLKRGQERFNIYCTPCHSRVGNGLGEIVQRGYKPAANLHDQVRLSQPVSHYFYVMTNGYGAMPDYAAQLTPADRWAVAAYIRALQLSQAAKESDVPAGVQVKNLKDVAQSEGLPASFADPWSMPATAVQPYEHDWKQGWPAMAPANPADPRQLAPNATKQPTGK
jgi:mono/diheme cytochrome c family protein